MSPWGYLSWTQSVAQKYTFIDKNTEYMDRFSMADKNVNAKVNVNNKNQSTMRNPVSST
jgi:hypothetical protein